MWIVGSRRKILTNLKSWKYATELSRLIYAHYVYYKNEIDDMQFIADQLLLNDDGDEDSPLSGEKVESFQRVILTKEMEEEEKGPICTICLYKLEAGETIVELPACRHKLHEECCKNYFKVSSKCPNCRKGY